MVSDILCFLQANVKITYFSITNLRSVLVIIVAVRHGVMSRLLLTLLTMSVLFTFVQMAVVGIFPVILTWKVPELSVLLDEHLSLLVSTNTKKPILWHVFASTS